MSKVLLFGTAVVYGVVFVDQMIKGNYTVALIHSGYFVSSIGYFLMVE
jgi:hypothetical protein